MRDPLTGLPNRSGFKSRLDHAAAARTGDQPLGVIYIDLDRFKEVNDSFGHDMGDKLLIAVTKRLTAMCRRKETLARLGGDEFAMIVEGMKPSGRSRSSGAAISTELAIPFDLDGTQVNIGGSVGVAVAPKTGSNRPSSCAALISRCTARRPRGVASRTASTRAWRMMSAVAHSSRTSFARDRTG